MAEPRRRTKRSEPNAGGSDGERAAQVGGEFAYSPSERELIVVAEPSARLQATTTGLASQAGADTLALAAVLDEEGVTLEPLFGPSEEAIRARASAAGPGADTAIASLADFYRARAADNRLDALASRLAAAPLVAGAYVKPPSEPAAVGAPARPGVAPAAPPAATPDFTGRQGYLGPAPGGIDAQWAAAQPGGGGAGVRIVDIEGAWLFTHEDLAQNAGGVLTGTPTADLGWRNHGTAVIGEFGADDNGIGVLGVAPDAVVRGASIFGGTGSAAAIRQAADAVSAGDIILLELHRPGPRFGFAQRNDQHGYIAIEWWPDDLAAVRYATSKGVLVVGAAGNGAEDLDDAIYDAPAAGFPASWQNPFNPANPTSGAVIVGAGAPPPGTHGANHGDDRSRLGFSNYGARVDAQGWGREVTTTGGRFDMAGDLQGGADETLWYTDTFSGTSSASPIVVGALAAIQGMQAAAGRPLLTPAQAQAVLRATGSPQQDGPNGPAAQRIGNRPDLRAAMAFLAPAVVQSGIATQYWDELQPYPPGGSPRLWFFVNAGWRRLDNPSALIQDMVQRAFLGTGSEVRVWHQGDVVVGLVVSGS
jgi:Subtilase family